MEEEVDASEDRGGDLQEEAVWTPRKTVGRYGISRLVRRIMVGWCRVERYLSRIIWF